VGEALLLEVQPSHSITRTMVITPGPGYKRTHGYFAPIQTGSAYVAAKSQLLLHIELSVESAFKAFFGNHCVDPSLDGTVENGTKNLICRGVIFVLVFRA